MPFTTLLNGQKVTLFIEHREGEDRKVAIYVAEDDEMIIFCIYQPNNKKAIEIVVRNLRISKIQQLIEDKVPIGQCLMRLEKHHKLNKLFLWGTNREVEIVYKSKL